jgi:hypothetical protein
MSRSLSRSFAQASLLAMTVGLCALGSTLTPAAALPSLHPGNTRLPSPSAHTAPGASMHPISAKIHVPQVAQTAPGASMYPVGAKIHAPQVVQTAPGASIYPGGAKTVPGVQTAPGASIYPGGAKTVPGVQTAPGASIYPGKLKTPEPTPINIGGGVDNICPFNKFKCPPPSAGSGSSGSSPQGSGSTGPMPGGQTYPSGGAGPVVIVAPPPVYQAPQPVYQAAIPVYQAPRPVVTATSAAPVAAEPCNCLTKQYLDDGSVLFKDICTKEAATATPDELKAQAQGAAPTVR